MTWSAASTTSVAKGSPGLSPADVLVPPPGTNFRFAAELESVGGRGGVGEMCGGLGTSGETCRASWQGAAARDEAGVDVAGVDALSRCGSTGRPAAACR